MITHDTINQIAEKLRKGAPEATFMLFGSYARGDAGENSDLDILVIEPVVKARRREMVRLSDILRPLHVPVDIIVVSRDNFEKWADFPGTIIYNAAKEGRILDAAA